MRNKTMRNEIKKSEILTKVLMGTEIMTNLSELTLLP